MECSAAQPAGATRFDRRHPARYRDTHSGRLQPDSAQGWTRPTPQLLVLLRGLVRLYHGRVVSVLEKYWRENPTDLALSVIPLFNRALAESICHAAPQTAFATLLTDLADCPPHSGSSRSRNS